MHACEKVSIFFGAKGGVEGGGKEVGFPIAAAERFTD